MEVVIVPRGPEMNLPHARHTALSTNVLLNGLRPAPRVEESIDGVWLVLYSQMWTPRVAGQTMPQARKV